MSARSDRSTKEPCKFPSDLDREENNGSNVIQKMYLLNTCYGLSVRTWIVKLVWTLAKERTSTTYFEVRGGVACNYIVFWNALFLASFLLMDNHGECSVSITIQYYSSVGYHRLYIKAASGICTFLPICRLCIKHPPFPKGIVHSTFSNCNNW